MGVRHLFLISTAWCAKHPETGCTLYHVTYAAPLARGDPLLPNWLCVSTAGHVAR